MKKNILKILILTLFFVPFISRATTGFMVGTNSATNITSTSATLHGIGGVSTIYLPGCAATTDYSTTTGQSCSENNTNTTTNTALPITAYFRYSEASTPPIFCNDTYGTNMNSTGDIHLGTTTTATYPIPFYQKITGLTPDTSYYYCAIISDKNNIDYGGTGVVETFHTSPLATTVTTLAATGVDSDSAQLNGSYSSTDDVKTYFEYQASGESVSGIWHQVGIKNYSIGSYNNLYGNINYSLSGLSPNTIYSYYTVAVDSNSGTTTGATLNFTTSPNSNNLDNGGSDNSGGGNGSDTSTPPVDSGIGGSGSGGGTVNNGENGGNSGGGNGGNGIINTTPLVLGQVATPPPDDVVRLKEGIETVFIREIAGDITFAKMYGYQEGTDIQTFAAGLADQFARAFGYVSSTGKEIRVSVPDLAAYQLQLSGNKLTVYEYYNGKIIDVRDVTTSFKDASGYEYNFIK
jgi:hypothetical protein